MDQDPGRCAPPRIQYVGSWVLSGEEPLAECLRGASPIHEIKGHALFTDLCLPSSLVLADKWVDFKELTPLYIVLGTLFFCHDYMHFQLGMFPGDPL